MTSNQNNGSGTHRGALAGLAEEAREAAVVAHLSTVLSEGADQELQEAIRQARLEDARDQSVHEKPVLSFRDALAKKSKKEILSAAFPNVDDLPEDARMGVKALMDAKKSDVIDVFVNLSASSWPKPQAILGQADAAQFNAIRTLLAQSDPLTFTEDQVAEGALKDLHPMSGVTTLFYHDRRFTLVLLEEMRAHFAEVDFKAAEELARKLDQARHVSEVLTDVCGIVSADDAYQTYQEWLGDEALPREAFDSAVESVLTSGNRPFGDWYHQGTAYFLNWQLDMDLERPGISEDVQGYLEYLVLCHQKAGRAALDPALAEKDALGFYLAKPAAIALRNFLDAHVPDGDDDFAFADRVMEEAFQAVVHDKYDEGGLLEIMEEESLPMDPATRTCLSQLAGQFIAAMPVWEDNGASAQ